MSLSPEDVGTPEMQMEDTAAGWYLRLSECAAGDKPSLLSRIGRGLKSLVTRSPSKQH